MSSSFSYRVPKSQVPTHVSRCPRPLVPVPLLYTAGDWGLWTQTRTENCAQIPRPWVRDFQFGFYSRAIINRTLDTLDCRNFRFYWWTVSALFFRLLLDISSNSNFFKGKDWNVWSVVPFDQMIYWSLQLSANTAIFGNFISRAFIIKFLFHFLLLNRLCMVHRQVVGKNVHATIPKGNMGYGQYTVPDQLSCRTYFCCFPLALTNILPRPLVPFF